jgi:hypothetical protein
MNKRGPGQSARDPLVIDAVRISLRVVETEDSTVRTGRRSEVSQVPERVLLTGTEEQRRAQMEQIRAQYAQEEDGEPQDMDGGSASETEWRACFRAREKIDYVDQRPKVGGYVICTRTDCTCCTADEKMSHWMRGGVLGCTCDASPMLALCDCCYARMEKDLPDELKSMEDERKQLAEEADKKEKAQKKKDEEEEAAAEKSGKRIPITRQLARKSSAKASKKFQEELRAARDRSETARDKARRKQLEEFETCERCKKRVRLGGGYKVCAKCICELEELEKAQKAEKEKTEKEKAEKEKKDKK